METRLTEWVARLKLITDSQYEFRRGMRTHNCSIILRTAIDTATVDGKKFYVAFEALKDAFFSTNLAGLEREKSS